MAQKQLLRSTFDSVSEEIKKTLKPQLKQLIDNYRNGQNKRDSVKKAIVLQDHLKELEGLVEEVSKKEEGEAPLQGDNALPSKSLDESHLKSKSG